MYLIVNEHEIRLTNGFRVIPSTVERNKEELIRFAQNKAGAPTPCTLIGALSHLKNAGYRVYQLEKITHADLLCECCGNAFKMLDSKVCKECDEALQTVDVPSSSDAGPEDYDPFADMI